MSDKQLRQAVVDELEFEPSIDAAHIGVAVEGGSAPLSGPVGSSAQRCSAETSVRRIEDVRAILVADASKVTLDGKVPTFRERDSAEGAAWSPPGVMKVEDHLRVA